MFGFGLTVAALGIGTVFIELVLLILVIYIISILAKTINGKDSYAVKKPVQEVEKPAPVAKSQVAVSDSEDEDILAVIAAAVAFLSSDGVRITAISRKSGVYAPAWSHAGRQESMNLRQM